jgi:hypothetical protein
MDNLANKGGLATLLDGWIKHTNQAEVDGWIQHNNQAGDV